MSNIEIKHIPLHEIDLIEPLWNALKQHHQDRTIDHTEYYLNSTFEKRKKVLLSKDKLAVFIAHHADEYVGFCVVSIDSNVGELDSLYVKGGSRNLGLGLSLTLAGMDWLKQQNPPNIRLLVGQGNESAVNFYEKLGFRVRATMMELMD